MIKAAFFSAFFLLLAMQAVMILCSISYQIQWCHLSACVGGRGRGKKVFGSGKSSFRVQAIRRKKGNHDVWRRFCLLYLLYTCGACLPPSAGDAITDMKAVAEYVGFLLGLSHARVQEDFPPRML